MQRHMTRALVMESELDCFGNFDIAHPLCKHHCALRLNCIVERNYSLQLEIIEEMNTLELHTRKPQ